MPLKLPPLSSARNRRLDAARVKEETHADGPSPESTPLMQHIDVLADLPKVA